MTELSFTPETAKITRAKKPNPFVDAVRSLTVDSDQGLAFDVASLKGIRSQLDRAAEEVGVTVRWKVTENNDGTHHVFFKAAKKITRKPAEEEATTKPATKPAKKS